ncbi:MAG: insulinase family protein [Patescibacteria group bacterium]
MHFDTTTLSNGLKVHYQERNVPWVHVLFLIHVGTRYDPIGKEGCAHVLEHHLSNGTVGKPLRNLMEIFSWGAEQGLQLMLGVTGPEGMWFSGSTAEDNAAALVAFLRDHIFHPSFAGEYKKDLDIVRGERAQKGTTRERTIRAAMMKALYGEHRLGSMTGVPEDDVLDALTQTDARTMHETYFHLDNLEIIGLGGMEMTRFCSLIEREMTLENGAAAAKPTLDPFPATTPTVPQRFFARETQRPASKLDLSYSWTVPAGTAASARRVTQVLKSFYNEKIREGLKASYGFGPSTGFYHDHGHISLGTSVAPDKKDIVMDAVHSSLNDVDALRRSFANYKQEKALNLKLMDKTGVATVEYANTRLLSGSPIRTIQQRLTSLNNWSFEDFMVTLNTWLTPERRYLQIVEH